MRFSINILLMATVALVTTGCVDPAESAMVSIPGGTFSMGDLSGEGGDFEKPIHSVTVPAFQMGKYEVTVGQFRRYVQDTGYRTDAEKNAGDEEGCFSNTSGNDWDSIPDRSWQNPGYAIEDNQPVVCVSWNDAQAFIAWLTAQTGKAYRLPTEAEWEYVARAGSTTKYHFGNDIWQLCRYANLADSSTDFDWRNDSCSDGVGKRPAAVGRYKPNSYGLYDMHGNVGEWVEDCWHDSYAGAPSDGSAWKSADCIQRVIRGGSWFIIPWDLRSANRSLGLPLEPRQLPRFPPDPGQVERRRDTLPVEQDFLRDSLLTFPLFPLPARHRALGCIADFACIMAFCLPVCRPLGEEPT